MNKFFSALLALSVVATPLAVAGQASAAPYHRDNHNNGPRHDSWVRGHRVSESDRRRAAPVDYRRYRLSAPPRGYHWVRVDNSFLLIGITSGLISNVLNAR